MITADKEIADLLSINEEDLTTELCTVAANYHYWATVSNDLQQKFKTAKLDLTRTRAIVIQNALAAKTDAAKKPTAAELDRLADINPTVLLAEKTLITLERDYKDALAITTALEMKSSNLRTIAASKRAELNNL